MAATYDGLAFSRPTDKVKTIGVDPVPQHIIDDMRKYEDAARAFNLIGFERLPNSSQDEARILLLHRPNDAQVTQIYRLPADPDSSSLKRLTHFDIGTGRTIVNFRNIVGEDWRGVWREGGAIMVMDLDGSVIGKIQIQIPDIDGELDNRPGNGRIERLTHDNFKYQNPVISQTNKIFAFTSNKENDTDTLVYVSRLIDSQTGAKADAHALNLPSKLITPPTTVAGKGASRWRVEDISIDDKYLLLTKLHGTAHAPLYIVDISSPGPSSPVPITLPGATEREEEIANTSSSFSRDPASPHLIYLVTDGYGDSSSVVSYDLSSHCVVHITTPEPAMRAIRPITWGVMDIKVTPESVWFRANIEGWHKLFVLPLCGPKQGTVIEVRPEWEGGGITYQTNAANGKPCQLVLRLSSYRSYGRLASVDLGEELQHVQKDERGDAYISVSTRAYSQARAADPTHMTLAPKLFRFKSFDRLEVPALYYHPDGGARAVPVVISIHGGPEGQSTPQSRSPIHGYILNEMNCAVIYPNVRGSTGYGRKYLSADDVYKREDAVNDIGSLLGHIRKNMNHELDSGRVAVMGGSYDGYMTFACLTHFSSLLTCGLATCGISHWPSFMRNTAPQRQAHRRREYGDERDPAVLEFLERISPITSADKIAIPLQVAHGENDTRVPVGEAFRMWETVKKSGLHAELIIGEKEGHGFKQKSVIEYCNAAKVRFLERYLRENKARN